jgi:hypothetical protein
MERDAAMNASEHEGEGTGEGYVDPFMALQEARQAEDDARNAQRVAEDQARSESREAENEALNKKRDAEDQARQAENDSEGQEGGNCDQFDLGSQERDDCVGQL